MDLDLNLELLYLIPMAEQPPTDNRCAYCPHQADINPAPRETSENPPFTQFRCGHRVHTHCFLLHLHISDAWLGRITCPECDQRIMNDDAVQFIRHRREDNPDRPNSVQNLWKDNEVFREEVREAVKVQREANLEWKKFTKSVGDLKKEWIQKTSPYKTILKNMRAEFANRYKQIPGRVRASMLIAKAQRMKRRIRDTYDLGYYELERLNRIKGAPKIGSVFHRRWLYLRMRPGRVFGFYF